MDVDLAAGADCDGLGQTGVMDVQERVGAEMLADADAAAPVALGLGDVMCSGRTPMVSAPCLRAVSPEIRFIVGEPMKPATKTFLGLR